MKPLVVIVCLSLATLARGQRPFFAGTKPIGIPIVTTEALADRYGEVDATTQRLPVEANGDRDLFDRLSKLPINQQPFWLINWQALEENRKKPQTYPQKPNVFADSASNNGGSVSNTNFENGHSNFNSGNVNPSFGNGSPASVNQVPNSSNPSPSSGNQSPNTGNQSPNSSNQIPNSGTASSQGFETSNRFGVEEYPKKEDKKKQENSFASAHTNINQGYGKPEPLGNLDKKKVPVHNNYYESYRF